jgi:uncharacterized protein (TIGR02453 family)
MFDRSLFTFLADLAEHNDRAWFTAHKADYERSLKAPALAFIEAAKPGLAAISPHIRCDARALFRIHRDTRFSTDKSPYKTHLGVHFRHEAAGDVHAPGLYLHLANDGCFIGAGIWHPDAPTLQRLRAGIVGDPSAWNTAMATVEATGFKLEGDSLARPPRGVDPDHEAIVHLKRKDHIAVAPVPADLAMSDGLLPAFLTRCEQAAPLMGALCGALDLPW